jgi:hypothetical protein
MAGFMCPPLSLPGRLMISPARSGATATATISSFQWIPVTALETHDGPKTNLTSVVMQKSRMVVRINSSILWRAITPEGDLVACVLPFPI